MILFFNNLPIKGVKFCQNIIILNFVKIFQLICNLNQVELLSSKNLRLDFDWENSRWRMVKPSPKNTNEKTENNSLLPILKKRILELIMIKGIHKEKLVWKKKTMNFHLLQVQTIKNLASKVLQRTTNLNQKNPKPKNENQDQGLIPRPNNEKKV